MLLYASSQVLLMLLWIWEWKARARNSEGQARDTPFLGNLVWYLLFTVGIRASVVTSIGGTSEYSSSPFIILQRVLTLKVFVLMQLFRNCLCFLPVSHLRGWSSARTVV